MTIKSMILKFAGIAVFFSLFLLFAWFFQQHMQELILSIETMGLWAPLIFIAVYCLATVFFLPTMVLTLAGGAVFGPIEGTFFNLLGATGGAACCFLISRYVAYDWFHKRKSLKLKRLIHAVDRHGWQSLAILRLLPLLPFNLVNYGMGITNIRFRVYLMISFIFLIPAEIIYTYSGHAGVHMVINPDYVLHPSLLLILALAGVLLLALQFAKKRRRLQGANDSLFDSDDKPKKRFETFESMDD